MTKTVIVSSSVSLSASLANAETQDVGVIRLGGAFRLPAPVANPVPPEVADQGRIRLGGAFRLPTAA